MATFEMKMKKTTTFFLNGRSIFQLFDKGSQDAILKISMEMQQSLICINFI